MQPDLRTVPAALAGTVAMTLIPALLIAFLSMPSGLHRHFNSQPTVPIEPVAHMT